MPNWCTNVLTVSGDAADVNRFIETACRLEPGLITNLVRGAVGDEPVAAELFASLAQRWIDRFGFSGHLPIPEALRSDSSPPAADDATRAARMVTYGATDWYQWCVQHWGTKWDVTDATLVGCETGLVRIRFETAWSPPTGWLSHVAGVHPTVRFTLAAEELGNGLRALIVAHGHDALVIREYPVDDEVDDDVQDEFYSYFAHPAGS